MDCSRALELNFKSGLHLLKQRFMLVEPLENGLHDGPKQRLEDGGKINQGERFG